MEYPSEHIKLVETLKVKNIIKSKSVGRAMKMVDRADFTDLLPYTDCPSPIGYDAKIGAPHMHAMILELMRDHLGNGKRVMDVGTGSGYFATLMSSMLPNGYVYSIEQINELTKLSKANIQKNNS